MCVQGRKERGRKNVVRLTALIILILRRFIRQIDCFRTVTVFVFMYDAKILTSFYYFIHSAQY